MSLLVFLGTFAFDLTGLLKKIRKTVLYFVPMPALYYGSNSPIRVMKKQKRKQKLENFG